MKKGNQIHRDTGTEIFKIFLCASCLCGESTYVLFNHNFEQGEAEICEKNNRSKTRRVRSGFAADETFYFWEARAG